VNKKIRFIEPWFVRENPSTNGLVDVAIGLAKEGWEIQVFAHECDEELRGLASTRHMPGLTLPFKLDVWGYFTYVNLCLFMDWLRSASFRGVTVSTGFLAPSAEIATVHFSHLDLIRKLIRHGRSQPGLLRQTLLSIPGIFSELILLWSPWKTRLLVVSRAVAGDISRFAAPWKDVRVLPNAVIGSRFNTTYRQSVRSEARKRHGFATGETVFVFASMGHHFRKGFFIAAKAIEILRQKGHKARLLVIGGQPHTLDRLRRLLGKLCPGFREWMVFTGWVPDPEFHYSAGDALIFPSLSEAFSLVEIEASALGLPLYLTPHHGSEMILGDGTNGRIIPWEPKGIADCLAAEIDAGEIKFTAGGTGSALSLQEYSRQWLGHISDFCRTDPARTSMMTTRDTERTTGREDAMAKPKLLLIGHTYMVGVNREKAFHLSEHFDVTVCTSDSEGWLVLGKAFTDEISTRDAEKYQLIRLKRWPHRQKYTHFTLRRLSGVFRDLRPEYILLENEPWSLLRWQARACAYLYCRDSVFCEFTWENVRRCGFKGLLLDWVYKAMAATSDLVVAGNKAAAGLLTRAGVDPDNIMITGQLGISESDFPTATPEEKKAWRLDHGWPQDAIVIGFCGRLVPEKGIALLYDAARSLGISYPAMRLACLGSGPMEKALMEKDDGSGFLKILPPVPHLEVGEFLNKLDIFVLPSMPLHSNSQNWEEQFGHVLIEAIVAGALTLGSDSGAIPEVLDDPEVIFHHSNTEEITEMLGRWLQKPAAMLEKARKQRAKCLRDWDSRALAEKYARFLKSPSV
jgi:glycosyltransferase involved in cell wall biosynthesis